MADNPRIEELRRRVQADPASIAFAALAEEYRRAGRYQEAIETCRTGLQRHPSYLSARVTLGRSLVQVGQFTEAREVLEHVLRAAPENLAAIRALAEIHERQGETPEALEQYRVALHVATQEAEAQANTPQPPTPPPPVQPAVVQATVTPARVATLEPLSVAPPKDQANAQALDGLERFLTSIQAARRSASRDNSGVAAC
jgi:tetratricopeptide (TPR) repeat protein